jgi:hypothetical protein
VAGAVAEEFGPVMLETAVPRTTRLSEMALRGKPSVIYDRRSAGSRAYFNLADEIMTRHGQRQETMVDDPAHDDRLDQPAAPGGDRVTEPAAVGNRLARNLETLLGDLRARGAVDLPSAPVPRDTAAPEMVSLEDLLAEEESGGSVWDENWRQDDLPN